MKGEANQVLCECGRLIRWSPPNEVFKGCTFQNNSVLGESPPKCFGCETEELLRSE